MINYLLKLISQAEDSVTVAETKNQELVQSISSLSIGLSEMDQLLENHSKKIQQQNYDQ